MFKSLLLKGRTICLLLCCLVSSLVVTAQTKHTGKVIGSDDKQPIVGASVRIKGTNTGAVTDVNGDFTLTIATGNVLEISYIGYTTKDVTIQGTAFLTISLDPVNNSLNEVVVTGYATQLKKDISGSVATINISDAKKIPTTSSEQLLQGQASGVTVINSGAPGAPSTVFVRGVSGFGNTTPLYVVDGVQASDMSLVNPSDIESISVLKDAGAAAIYGISGGNGVVVITTKKGKAGKTAISYDGYYGSQQPLDGNVWHLMNPSQQSALAFTAGDLATEKLYPGGSGTVPTYGYHGSTAAGSFGVAGVTNDPAIASYYHFDSSNPGADFLVQKFAQGGGTDWFHSVFTAAPEQQHTITASGGNDKNTYLTSLNYINQTGTLLNTYERRYAARVNTSFTKGIIHFGETGSATYRENIGGYNGDQQNEGGSIAYTYREMPIIPVFDIAGNYGGGYAGPGGEPLGNGSNPYAIQARRATDNAHYVLVQGNVFAEADIAKYLNIRTSYGGTLYNQYYWGITYNPYENYESHTNPNGANENEQIRARSNWTTLLTYKETFGKHNVKVLGGYEQRVESGRELHATNNNYFSLDPNYVRIGAADVVAAPYSGIDQPRGIKSLFGRLDYSYNDRYILGASFRHDGVSTFAPGHQYGNFPSVSLAWRISQEDFLKGVNWLNDLKLRASYGELGSYADILAKNAYDGFDSGQGSSYYGINGGINSITQGFFQNQNGNKNVSWEVYKISNFGFDATLFNHLDIVAEYYKKGVSGLLFQKKLPALVGGADAPIINIGDVENKGIDISATYHDRISKDLTFSLTATITTYHNNITYESNSNKFFTTGGSRDNDIVRNEVGNPVGEFYGYQTAGIYQSDAAAKTGATYSGAAAGSFIYKDVNGDGKIDDKDRTFIGNPNPDFTYGFNASASYKGFDFSLVFYGSQGNKDFNYVKYWTDFYSTFQGGKNLDLFNKAAVVQNGVVTNPGATLPAASYSQAFGSSTVSSFYVEDGSFLKCRVLQIGYSFEPALLKSIGFDKLHVYVQGTNLFTLTKYTGLDPELIPSLSNQGSGGNASAAFGIDYGAYPTNQKQYIAGVNLTF